MFGHQAQAPGAGKKETRRRAVEGTGGGSPGDPESICARKSLGTQEIVRGYVPRQDS